MEADGVEETRFQAMGTDVDVVVVGGPAGLAGRARARIADLERRWSRFRPDSELCALNRADGHPVVVSAETATVVALAVDAWRATAGRFDPTVLEALVAAGYDRSFERLAASGPAPGTRQPGATPGCDGIVADPANGLVLVPHGRSLDLGGIGKGHAADVVAAELLAAGAVGACVNVGGDLRAMGQARERGPWWIGVEDELARGERLGLIEIGEGGVATTTSVRRRWRRGDEILHHLIDPRTGGPADTGLVSVTVLAATAAWAEVLAKAAYVEGLDEGLAIVSALGGHAIFVTECGDVVLSEGFAGAVAS